MILSSNNSKSVENEIFDSSLSNDEKGTKQQIDNLVQTINNLNVDYNGKFNSITSTIESLQQSIKEQQSSSNNLSNAIKVSENTLRNEFRSQINILMELINAKNKDMQSLIDKINNTDLQSNIEEKISNFQTKQEELKEKIETLSIDIKSVAISNNPITYTELIPEKSFSSYYPKLFFEISEMLWLSFDQQLKIDEVRISDKYSGEFGINSSIVKQNKLVRNSNYTFALNKPPTINDYQVSTNIKLSSGKYYVGNSVLHCLFLNDQIMAIFNPDFIFQLNFNKNSDSNCLIAFKHMYHWVYNTYKLDTIEKQNFLIATQDPIVVDSQINNGEINMNFDNEYNVILDIPDLLVKIKISNNLEECTFINTAQ